MSIDLITPYRQGFMDGFNGVRYFNFSGDKEYYRGYTKGARQRAIRQYKFLPINTINTANKGVKKKIVVNIK